MRVFLGALTLMLMACDGGPRPVTLSELVEQHTIARGGARKLEAVKTIEVELEIVEPKFTLTGLYRATREGHMRIDVFAGDQRVFTEALGPDGGWQMFDDGKTVDLSEDGEKALIRGVTGNLYALHERIRLGYAVTLKGTEQQQGKTYYQLEEVALDGFSKQLFMDAETFLISHDMETSALHPDIDATKQRQETRHLDFAALDGIVFSNRQETYDRDTGERIQETTMIKRTINAEIDPEVFRRPTKAE